MTPKEMTVTEMISARQEYNKKILDVIAKVVEEYPMLRFGQILCNMFRIDNRDCFYDESVEMFNSIPQNYKEL